jgi:hypothetical protein
VTFGLPLRSSSSSSSGCQRLPAGDGLAGCRRTDVEPSCHLESADREISHRRAGSHDRPRFPCSLQFHVPLSPVSPNVTDVPENPPGCDESYDFMDVPARPSFLPFFYIKVRSWRTCRHRLILGEQVENSETRDAVVHNKPVTFRLTIGETQAGLDLRPRVFSQTTLMHGFPCRRKPGPTERLSS